MICIWSAVSDLDRKRAGMFPRAYGRPLVSLFTLHPSLLPHRFRSTAYPGLAFPIGRFIAASPASLLLKKGGQSGACAAVSTIRYATIFISSAQSTLSKDSQTPTAAPFLAHYLMNRLYFKIFILLSFSFQHSHLSLNQHSLEPNTKTFFSTHAIIQRSPSTAGLKTLFNLT
jgi:hypothetical protein